MAAAKSHGGGNMFEAARKAFFSMGDASPSAVLPNARETVFTKEVPTAPEAAVEQKLAGARESAAAESIAAAKSAAAQEEEAQILVHA